MAGTKAIVFMGLHRGQAGEPEPVMVILSVCSIHYESVVGWCMTRAVTEGMSVDIDSMADLQELERINRKVHSKGDPWVSNAAGGVALVPA